MPRTSKKEFCSRSIDFPQSLYLGFIWVSDNDGAELLIPSLRLFQSTEKTMDYLSELQYTYKLLNRLVDRDILIIPLTLKESVPLKRSHWSTHAKEKDLYQQLGTYVDAIREHKDSQILVVSQGFDDDFEKFSHVAAMSIDTDMARLEKIILASDTYVDPTSKEAAIYLLDTPLAVFPNDNQIRITNFGARKTMLLN